MSNKFAIWLLGFIPGGLAGGTLIGIICGREYRKRLDALNEENNELTQKLMTLKREKIAERKEAEVKKQETVEAQKQKAEVLTKELQYVSEDSTEQREEDIPEPADPDSWADEAVYEPVEASASDIYVIDAEAFKQDLARKEGYTLTYYQGDGILVDERNDVMETGRKMLGDECYESLAKTEEDFIYVANDVEDCMYEVVVEHNESFYRDVIGCGG